MRPNGGGEVTISAKGASYDNASLLEKTFTGKQSENAALWSLGVGEQFTIAGKIPVQVRAKVDNVGEGDNMMSAVLVDAADAPFATYAMGAMPRQKPSGSVTNRRACRRIRHRKLEAGLGKQEDCHLWQDGPAQP